MGAAAGTDVRSNDDLLISELVSTKGSHAWFDASGAQGDEEEPHHGQHTECEEECGN